MVTNRLDWPSGEVEVTGGRLAYHRTGGKGPPIVLSHGLSDNGLCWARLAEALSPDYDLILLDARGHGASSRPGEAGISPDMPGRDIAEAIRALGLSGVIAMGHSMGAACALLMSNFLAEGLNHSDRTPTGKTWIKQVKPMFRGMVLLLIIIIIITITGGYL